MIAPSPRPSSPPPFLRSICIGAAVLLSLAFSPAARALEILPSNSGLDMGFGCEDVGCSQVVFELDELVPSPVSGSISLAGNLLSFSIDLPFASFSGTDGAVTGVEFSNVIYSGAVTVSVLDGGFLDIDDAQTASVSGTLTPLGAGSPVAFNATTVLVDGILSGGTSSLFGGLIFGAPVDFSANVNGQTRYFKHTVDISAVPEPGTAVLLGAGLGLLATARRNRPSSRPA